MLQKTQLDEVFLHKKKELFDESLKSLVGLSKGDDFLSSHIPSNYQRTASEKIGLNAPKMKWIFFQAYIFRC